MSAGLEPLVTRLGLPGEPSDLALAMVHRSYSYEHGRVPTNERLEFLGDSVLGVVVTEQLYREYPDLPEGHLAKMRSAVVNAHSLAEVARQLDLGSYVQLGRGEETTGGRDKHSILADALEAVIGAVYLDFGLEVSRDFVLRIFADTITDVARLGAGLDWKTSLQELTARHGLGVPEYDVVGEGPDHERSFTASVIIGESRYGHGVGPTKKQAEQQAAESAFREISAATGDA